MNRITVALDLGPSTDTLVAYAAHLARDLEASVVQLVHVHQLFAEEAIAPASFLAEQQALRELQDVAKRIRQDIGDRVIRTEYSVVYGSVENALLRASRGTDLLLLGQTLNTGIWRFILGDVTEGVLERATCPLLVVPIGHAWQNPSRISLAVDDQALAPKAIPFLRRLAKAYGSSLDIFHLDDGDDRYPSGELADLLGDIRYTYHFERGRGSLADYLIEASAGVRADWLTMIHHHRPQWREWFRRNQSERVAEQSPMPVLILPDWPSERDADSDETTDQRAAALGTAVPATA